MTSISFKVSNDQARTIRERARKERLTVSEFIRRQTQIPSQPASKIKLRTCPHTGASIFEGTNDLSPLTVETTRELLADFP